MRWFGAFLALAVCLGAGYEFVALVTPLPTISRIIQGWRDSGAHTAVTVLTTMCVAVLAYFGAWLHHHFRYERRSKN